MDEFMLRNKVARLLLDTAARWGLKPLMEPTFIQDEWRMNSTIVLAQDGGIRNVSVKVVVLFGELFVIYVLVEGRTRPYHLDAKNYTRKQCGGDEATELDEPRLQKYFNSYIFAPILQRDRELPALAHLSAPTLNHVLTYLRADDLCRVSVTCHALAQASRRDGLWEALVTLDFKPQKGARDNGNAPTARSTYVQLFQRRKAEMKAYIRQQSQYQHWQYHQRCSYVDPLWVPLPLQLPAPHLPFPHSSGGGGVGTAERFGLPPLPSSGSGGATGNGSSYGGEMWF